MGEESGAGHGRADGGYGGPDPDAVFDAIGGPGPGDATDGAPFGERRIPSWLPRAGAAGAAVVLAVAALAVTGSGGDGDDGVVAPVSDVAADEHPVVPVAVDCGPWDALAPAPPPPAPPDLTPLAVDGALRRGALDNGLRYFVRTNTRPGASVMLALAVDAGAAVEDDDQHGAAHFLEHMLFNGTEGFPGNELEAVLGALGVQFGADLNAFTTEDATVYFLELSNELDQVDEGLDVLLEWATRATLDSADVADERGVVLEERRTGLGPDDRFVDRIRDLALAGTPYEGHEVVGSTDSITTMTPEALRRFYEDWYRPDLITVVAVGDVDADRLVAGIRDRFGSIGAPGASARPKPVLESGLLDQPRFGSYIDDELGGTSAEVVFTHAAPSLVTVDDLRHEVLRTVAVAALGNRLNDDAIRGTVPYYDVDVEVYRQVREFESLLVSVDAEPEQLDAALESLVQELARVRREGLTDAEVARAIDTHRAVSLTDRAAAASTQDRELLFRFVGSALSGQPTIGSEDRAAAELALLDQITAEEVVAELASLTPCAEVAIQAGVPSDFAASLPDETRIAELLSSVTGDLPPRPAEPPVPDALMARPDPVAPVGRGDTELFGPARYLEYRNGARVVINPSDIAAGQVTVVATGPGGLAEVEVADLANARAASELVSASGVGDLDAVTLEELLAGVDAFAVTTIGPDTESVQAGGSAADVETILQLVDQRMTAPRIDAGALARYRGEHRLVAENPFRRADTALLAAIDDMVWDGDGRLRSLTTAADLDQLDPARALDVHRDRFGDVSDFVFVIVGDIDLDTATDLANRYIGTLPSIGRVEDGKYRPPVPPVLVRTRTVEAGSANQASVEVVFDVDVGVDPALRDGSSVLQAVLDNRLRDRLREQLGVTYTPSTSVVVDERRDRIRTFIDVASDPDRVDEVAAEVIEVVRTLQELGPSDDDVREAVEPIVRDLQFIDHPTIVETWVWALTHPDRPVQDAPAAAELRLGEVDRAVIQGLARRLLPLDAYVQIVQVPASG